MDYVEHIRELNNKITELTNMNLCMNNLILDWIHNKLLNIYNNPKVGELLNIMSELLPGYTMKDPLFNREIMRKSGIIKYASFAPEHANYLINKFDANVAIKILHDEIEAILNDKIDLLSQTNLGLTQTLNSLGIPNKSDEV